jgi:hypothetical protein
MWAAKRERGIEIDAQVTDVTNAGTDRPYRRNVQWTEHYLDGTVVEDEIEFVNTTSSKSRAAEDQAKPTE